MIKSIRFGKILLLDRITNISEYDEPFYSEMMAHVPMMAHPNPKKVLIIGGGDGGVSREVLRHSQLETLV